MTNRFVILSNFLNNNTPILRSKLSQ